MKLFKKKNLFKIMSEEITLIKLLEVKYLRHKHATSTTLSDITFDIMKELFLANESRHLNPESAIFLHCKNSSKHMSNIVHRIFLLEEHTSDVVNDELSIIIEEMQNNRETKNDEELMCMKEEIKQVIFRRSGQIHAHINSIDAELGDIKQQIDEISNQEEILQIVDQKMASMEKTILTQNRIIVDMEEKFKDTVGNLIASIVPHIVEDILSSNQKIGELTSNIEKVTTDLRSIKKTIAGDSHKTMEHKFKIQRPHEVRSTPEQQSFV